MHLSVLSGAELTSTLLAAGLLLLFSFVFGKLFEKLHAPKVVGQITGGIILGGTCLHHFFPGNIEAVFMAFPEEGKILNIFYQLGLIFLMFASGLNTKLELKGNIKLIRLLFVGATFLPFAAGYFLYGYFESSFIGTAQSEEAFMLVFLISLAVTSIPVISQIFFDLGLMSTTFSNIVLTVATIQDLFLWIFLNLAISMVTGAGTGWTGMATTIAVTILLFVIAHQVSRLHDISLSLNSASFCTLVYAFLFFMVALLSDFHINIMYSSFIAGYVVRFIADQKEEYLGKVTALSEVAFSSFIPIYFALIGIQINLIHDFTMLNFLAFFVISFGLEFLGCYVAMRFVDIRPISRVNFSIVMNARGGPGIVLATVAYYYEIISVEFFTILILTTMLSSALAGYWLEYQKGKDETMFMEI